MYQTDDTLLRPKPDRPLLVFDGYLSFFPPLPLRSYRGLPTETHGPLHFLYEEGDVRQLLGMSAPDSVLSSAKTLITRGGIRRVWYCPDSWTKDRVRVIWSFDENHEESCYLQDLVIPVRIITEFAQGVKS